MNHLNAHSHEYDKHLERMKKALEREEARLAKICEYCKGEKKEEELFCEECTEFLKEQHRLIK